MRKTFMIFITVVTTALFLAGCGEHQSTYYAQVDEDQVLVTVPPLEIYEHEDEIEEYIQEPETSAKIAVLHRDSGTSRFDWLAALEKRYGAENVLIYTWPDLWFNDFVAMQRETIINEIVQNQEISVLIVNPARYGTDYFMGMLREQRDDIFVVYLDYSDDEWSDIDLPFRANNLSDATVKADLILGLDEHEWLQRFPAQAQALGATAMVYFYNEGQWDWDEETESSVFVRLEESEMHRLLREKSAEIGLGFIEVDIENAIQCGSSYHMFTERVIPPLFQEYGKDIVLFGIWADRELWRWWVEDFIYLPMHPPGSWSDPHPMWIATELSMFDDSLLDLKENEIPEIIEKIREVLEQRDLLGRIAGMPIPMDQLLPIAAVEYSMLRTQGEVPEDGIDVNVLQLIMIDIIADLTGLQNHGVSLRAFTQNGATYENYILVLVDHLIY